MTRPEKFCYVPIYYRATLSRIVAGLLQGYHDQPRNQMIPDLPEESFEKKLYSMYMFPTYLEEAVAYDLPTKTDERGKLHGTRFKTNANGQVSVNIIKPGQTRGKHWHTIQSGVLRRSLRNRSHPGAAAGDGPGAGATLSRRRVPGFGRGKMQAVHMLPGHTHSITNTSATENLVVVMWANELFQSGFPGYIS